VVEEVLERECNIFKKTAMIFEPQLWSMFCFPYKFRLLAGIVLTLSQQGSGSVLLLFYSTDVFDEITSANKYLLTALMGIGNVLGKPQKTNPF
jgi:hypothetical protein